MLYDTSVSLPRFGITSTWLGGTFDYHVKQPSVMETPSRGTILGKKLVRDNSVQGIVDFLLFLFLDLHNTVLIFLAHVTLSLSLDKRSVRDVKLEPASHKLSLRRVGKHIMVGIHHTLVLFLIFDLHIVLNVPEDDLNDAISVILFPGRDAREDLVQESSTLG